MATKTTNALSNNNQNAQGEFFLNASQNFYTKMKNPFLLSIKENIDLLLSNQKRNAKDSIFNNTTKNSLRVLLAVSGGVDSQVMLHSVFSLQKYFGYCIDVVTVNHNLRPHDESKADADLVCNYCKEALGVHCEVITIEQNEILALEKKRKQGIEEAARFVRYTNIENYAKSIQADVVFFAHNYDDQLETLIQHFLQGASAGISGFASSGIRQMTEFPRLEKNDSSTSEIMLFRPMLTSSREKIEAYAKENNVPFNTDKTNNEIIYLRNRIRHILIPVLNEHFTGWDSSIINGGKKALQEALFIQELSENIHWENEEGVKTKASEFYSHGYPVRVRSLYKAFEIAGVKGRVSYDIVHAAVSGQKRVEGAGIEIFQRNGFLFVRNKENEKYQKGSFYLEVNACGLYKTEYGTFEVKPTVEKPNKYADTERGDYCVGEYNLPLVIRSKLPGDKVLTAQGTHKLIKKIFSEWHVDTRYRLALPCIEYKGELVCIWGSLYRYNNWYVKQEIIEQDSVCVRFVRNN